MPEIYFLEEISNDDINPYEAVILASHEARRINQTRQMFEVSEDAEKPTTVAIKWLAEGKVTLAREGEADDAGADDEASPEAEAGTAGG